ncbi:MAG: bacteriocin family protein [Planctomycetes bacterium]|nr:bacteriocin family protein [Planctomycetota bacterium]
MKNHQKVVEVPLSEAQLKRIQDEIVREARRTLVGRRFINVFGPIGAGVESISFDSYKRDEAAEIHLEGQADPNPIGAHTAEEYRRIPLIYKDFLMHWRDVKWSQDTGSPVEAGNAILATHFVAHREDDLLFNGHAPLGITGLANAPGANRVKGGDWKKCGAAFQNVLSAVDLLQKSNYHPPYAITLSVDSYNALIKAERETPVLEIDQIARLCTDGVFQSHVLPEKTSVLVATGDQNLDIAVAEDLSLAYLGPRDMNYAFRVYESIVLRVKRPKAICVVQTGG